MHRLGFIAVFVAASLSASRALGGEDECDCEYPTLDEIKAAVARSIPLLESSAVVYRKERECFGCHHQALPVLALTEARRHGFAIDEANYGEQLKRTAEHLKRGEESYRKGEGQGGRADTAGWALWTLETGGWKPDDTTGAVAGYLLARHQESDHWRSAGNRPPTEASAFTTTYVAVRGLSAFGSAEQQEKISDRKERALKWLLTAEPKDAEDRVFRLRALAYLGADEEAVKAAADELKKAQRDDGGWSQLADLESDAYATATVLVALHESADLPVDDDVYRRGLKYLVQTQLADGSWHVKTRSKPIQKYFESGFPHEKDQFISISSTSWAVTALALASKKNNEIPSPQKLQQLFELEVRKGKIEHELSYVERKIAELEQEQFAGFERVATPLGSDYWESISDNVLIAKATGDIRARELLLYHAPGIYRVKDVRPKLTTEGECWYFLPDREIRKGEEFTIIPDYSRVASGDEAIRGRDPTLPYKTEISIPGRPRKESSTEK